ncbi:M15 family metallopeptidase [Myroides sp. LJL110]
MKIQTLKPNTTNPLIIQWKRFQSLIGNYSGLIDDYYDAAFLACIKRYQNKKKLVCDGNIGNKTWFEAYKDGMKFFYTQTKDFPIKPEFSCLESDELLFQTFGEIEFIHQPTRDNPERVLIVNDFETQNIVQVDIPQLKHIFGAKDRVIRFHRKAREQLRGFFNEVEKQGMLSLLLSYGGSYNPRFIRGSTTKLSNHCFGTAFDINMQWNGFNKQPQVLGKKGSIRELVPLANEYGFYWGGHFTRQDGMHFEVAKVL